MLRTPIKTFLLLSACTIVLIGAGCQKKTITNTNTTVRTPIVRLITDGERLAKKKLTFTYSIASTCDTPPCPTEERKQTVKIASDNTAPLPIDGKIDDLTIAVDGYIPAAVKSGLRRPNGDWEVRLQPDTGTE